MSATPAAKASHGSSTSRSESVISAYPADQDRRLPAACPHHSALGRTTGEAGMVIVCRRRFAGDRRSGDYGGIRQMGEESDDGGDGAARGGRTQASGPDPVIP